MIKKKYYLRHNSGNVRIKNYLYFVKEVGLMNYQSEVWIILEDDERNQVWDKVYSEFNFSPSINRNIIPFTFKIPVDTYDISTSQMFLVE